MSDSNPTLTYDEVVEALEVCNSTHYDIENYCKGCPLENDPERCDVVELEAIRHLKRLGQENEELKKKLWNGAYCI